MSSREPPDVVVYRVFGGDSVIIANCSNVKQMLYQVDKLTDWFWRVGACWVKDMDTSQEVRGCRWFDFGKPNRFQIIYAIRVSFLGFSGFDCCHFVNMRILARAQRRTDEHSIILEFCLL